MVKIDYSAKVDIGTKETNDDRVLVAGQILDMYARNGSVETPAIAVVCDGCGGYAGGGIAAQTVLETLAQESPESLAQESYLAEVLEKCRQAVVKKKEEMPQFSAMCTTVAGCVLCDDGILIFHSGDSRVYRHDRWGLARMTKDHSIVQEMVDFGEITPEEAIGHPKSNIISRCIGIDGPAPEIYVSHIGIRPGEKYLLCSDGLWEGVTDDQIREILDSDMTLTQMVNILIEKALSQGADDNVSVCIFAAQGAAKVVESKPFILD